MTKLVSSVFKIMIISILLGTFYTLMMLVIDVFATTNRLQNIAEYVQTDISKSNCLTNKSYNLLLDELYLASSKSSHMKVTAKGIGESVSGYANGGALKDKPPVYLYPASLTTENDAYIQKTASQTGEVISDASSRSHPTEKYVVANYGDVLVFEINAKISPQVWIMQGNMKNSGWLVPDLVPVTLSYRVPALAYIKS